MGKLSHSVYIFILNEFYVYTGLKYKNFKQFGNNLGVWREPLYHFREPKEPKFILRIDFFGTLFMYLLIYLYTYWFIYVFIWRVQGENKKCYTFSLLRKSKFKVWRHLGFLFVRIS